MKKEAETTAKTPVTPRRSSRTSATAKPDLKKSASEAKAPVAEPTKARKKAAVAPKNIKAPESATTADSAVKRKVGRPRGSTKTATMPVTPKTPGRRGRKPKALTAAATKASVSGTEAGAKTEAIEEQVSKLDVAKKPTERSAKAVEQTAETTLSKRGRKRKVEEENVTPPTTKKRATQEKQDKTPAKRGRPAGTGKRQLAVAKEAKDKSTTKTQKTTKIEDAEDTEGDFNGIKLTIERCTTCTQYHKNVKRIFKLTTEQYPHALVHEEVVPNSKSFEIYLSINGSKNKLIWSGKAHAPPKRLAFPDSDVFVNLLKAEFKDE
ncbi:hypothetical protein BG011_005829 [Mortierella polycephala]|uniref:Selenoprotein H n=1 Tax=Mortierella polycephala TaxID=41804 RepID=A0A9P6PWQ0_9FUNG|nr:hypothetical protein BG011_005829 [Mortierella polycephala]